MAHEILALCDFAILDRISHMVYNVSLLRDIYLWRYSLVLIATFELELGDRSEEYAK